MSYWDDTLKDVEAENWLEIYPYQYRVLTTASEKMQAQITLDYLIKINKDLKETLRFMSTLD